MVSVLMAFFLSLSGYASEVYPNLQFNLGGGQPQIVQLQIDHENLTSVNDLGIYADTAYQPQPNKAVLTQPVAIWYQSSRYIYLTPLPNKGHMTTLLVAVTQDQVVGIRHLKQYIKVESGGRITNVLPLP